MRLEAFHFEFPENLIAQYPLKERDASRLLVLNRKTAETTDCDFYDIHKFFHEGDVLVVNDTKVLPARFFGHFETGGKVEVVLLQEMRENHWKCITNAMKKTRIGSIIKFSDSVVAEVVALHEEIPILKFFYSGSWGSVLKKLGHIPLPPYLKRDEESVDETRYQTVYAENEGAVAAPTAGLHFSHRVLKLLENSGVKIAPITLHVGYGTFQPVRSQDMRDHRMHGEYFNVSEGAAIAINKAKRIICVGTSSLRALEASWLRGEVRPTEGCTNLFIYPGYRFHVAHALVTNFHQPQSTLFMLVSAFAGLQTMQQTYRHAISQKYRLFSYGDAMLIL